VRESGRAGKRRGPDAGLAVAVAGSWGGVAVARCSMGAGAEAEPEADPVADDVDDAAKSRVSQRCLVDANVTIECDGEGGRVGRGWLRSFALDVQADQHSRSDGDDGCKYGYRVRSGAVELDKGRRAEVKKREDSGSGTGCNTRLVEGRLLGYCGYGPSPDFLVA
jgi:hypothetical protein